MDTPRWHRDTTLLALATSLDHMLSLDHKPSITSSHRHSPASRKIRGKMPVEVLGGQQAMTVSRETTSSNHS